MIKSSLPVFEALALAQKMCKYSELSFVSWEFDKAKYDQIWKISEFLDQKMGRKSLEPGQCWIYLSKPAHGVCRIFVDSSIDIDGLSNECDFKIPLKDLIKMEDMPIYLPMGKYDMNTIRVFCSNNMKNMVSVRKEGTNIVINKKEDKKNIAFFCKKAIENEYVIVDGYSYGATQSYVSIYHRENLCVTDFNKEIVICTKEFKPFLKIKEVFETIPSDKFWDNMAKVGCFK